MKKFLMVLALVSVLILTVYGALSGTYTTNGNFYLPGFGSYGVDEFNEYNKYMQIADTQIEANKTAFGSYYLKTEIDSFSELQAIISDKTLVNAEAPNNGEISIYVDNAGDDSNSGFSGSPVQTLAQAISNIPAIPRENGADITVSIILTAGQTFDIDNLYIKVPWVSYLNIETSSAGNNAILEVGNGVKGLIIYRSFVDLTDITIQKRDTGQTHSLYIRDHSQVRVRDNCNFSGATSAEIALYRQSSMYFTGTLVGDGTAHGIVLSSSSYMGVFSNADISDYDRGVFNDGVSSSILSSGTIDNCTKGALAEDGALVKWNGIDITNCTHAVYAHTGGMMTIASVGGGTTGNNNLYGIEKNGYVYYEGIVYRGSHIIVGDLLFEGDTLDAHETTFSITEPTGDRTITVPDSDQTIGVATSIQDDLILKADFADEDWGDFSVSTNVVTLDVEVIDSDQYIDGSIDHEHLAPDVITGLTEVTSTDLDMIIIADQSDSFTLKKVDMSEVRGGGGGYTDLTEFVDQTAWRVFYSNTAGDVVELPLGADGTYLGSNGVAVAPSFSSPSSGSGDKTNWVIPQDYATGAGTEANPWAGDCINDAYTACPTGGTIYLRAGYYALDTLLNLAKAINIVGEGIGKTFIITGMTNTNALYTTTDYITLQGFTLDCASQTAHASSGINIQNADYVTIKDVEVTHAGKEAISCFQDNHLYFQNLYLHDNHEHGIHPGCEAMGRNMYNTYRDIYCWNNEDLGFYDRGNDNSGEFEECYNVFDNIQTWDNGGSGFSVTHQRSATISNCYSYGNTGNGFTFDDLDDSNFINCVATLNGVSGFRINNSKNVNITNIISLNNDSLGMYVINCTNIKLHSCQAFDTREVTGTDIAFVDGGGGADTITQTAALFVEVGFEAGETITISGSASNDGDETIVSVVAGTITLATGTLVAEGAGATVTITQYKQNRGIQYNTGNTNLSFVDCKWSPNINNPLGDSSAISMVGVVDGDNAVAGDIMYHNGTNWIRLAKGTAGQVLTMNAGGTAPEWQTP